MSTKHKMRRDAKVKNTAKLKRMKRKRQIAYDNQPDWVEAKVMVGK